MTKPTTYTIIARDPKLCGRFMPYGCGYDDPGTLGWLRREEFKNGTCMFGVQAVSLKQAAYLAKKRGMLDVMVVKGLNSVDELGIPHYVILFDGNKWEEVTEVRYFYAHQNPRTIGDDDIPF